MCFIPVVRYLPYVNRVVINCFKPELVEVVSVFGGKMENILVPIYKTVIRSGWHSIRFMANDFIPHTPSLLFCGKRPSGARARE